MDASLVTLAAQITAFLAPVLPHLVPPLTKATEKMGEEFGTAIWDGARNLWAKLWPQVEGKEPAREAALDVAKAPDDPRTQVALALQFEKILAGDETLATEIEALWRSIEGDIASESGAKITVRTQIAKNLANITGTLIKDAHVGDIYGETGKK